MKPRLKVKQILEVLQAITGYHNEQRIERGGIPPASTASKKYYSKPLAIFSKLLSQYRKHEQSDNGINEKSYRIFWKICEKALLADTFYLSTTQNVPPC